MPSPEAGGAEQSRPGDAAHHLHRRAQPPVPTHRNSLSGSTRQKHPPLTPSDGGDGGGYDRLLSPNRPSSSQLPSPDKTQIADSMEDELLLVRRRSWNDEEVELKEEEELLAAGTAYSAEEDEALYLGMDMVSINSGYSDEGGSLEDHIFRSRWLSTIDTAAAAGGR
ncbi:hypothetical protein Cni_G07282 [Canna indica]|uniref:Uncharacterized protein n=1 Tax=Canna indica TaxID=4628 RepID=A0AAQ3K3H3_9LILI|nr:hypothetical protein Cni_G07282 [Canna indica]